MQSPDSARAPPHYATLGVEPTITQKELERSYRKLSLQLHPDRAAYRDDPSQEPVVRERYQAVTEAYTILSDPQKRTAYDVQFGVNFLSRVQGLSRAIGAHNAETGQRQMLKRDREDTGETPVNTDTATAAATQVRPSASPQPRDEEEEEEEEEYAPESTTSHSAGLSSKSQRSGSLPLTVHRRRITPSDTVPQFRGVDVRRPYSPAPVWGLTIVGHTLRHVAQDAGVPFPAVITHVNGRGLRAHDTIAEVIHATTPASATICEETNQPLSVLSLTLTFTTEVYDLVGDVTALMEASVLDQLIPPTQITTEMAALLPGRAILAVNDEPVDTGSELRAALKRAAQKRSASGRFGGGVFLECSSTEGT